MHEQFTVGKVLSTGLRIWAKNIIPFSVITAIIYLPLIVTQLVLTTGHFTRDRLELIAWIYEHGALLSLPLSAATSAALTYGVVMDLQGQRASFGACVATGFRRFLPSLLVSLLVTLCVTVGFVALIVPGVILSCMLAVATQVSVIEKPGVGASLTRSRTLTKGRRVGLFGLLFVEGMIIMGTQLVVQNGLIQMLSVPAFIYVDLLRILMVGSLTAVMSAVTYFYLRQEKEGTSAAELGQVFA